MAKRRIDWAILLMVLVGSLVFVSSVKTLSRSPLISPPEQMRLAVSVPLEVLVSAGDRFLASNIGIFRAWTLGYNVRDAISFQNLAQVHRNIATMNPWHADNYYYANAILLGAGEVDAAQFALGRATEARYWDEFPPFMYALNQATDLKDVDGAIRAMLLAEQRTTGYKQTYFRDIRATWIERGDNLQVSIDILKKMYENEQHAQLKNIIGARIARISGLAALRNAASVFQRRHGFMPKKIDDLIGAGLLPEVPQDPFGMGYTLDQTGTPILQKRRGR